MDDPIFDPWSEGDDQAPTPTPQRPSRWRSARHSTHGVPASRPLPGPLGAPVDRPGEAHRAEDTDGAAAAPRADALVHPVAEAQDGPPAAEGAPHRSAWPDPKAPSRPDALDDVLAAAPAGSRADSPTSVDHGTSATDAPDTPEGTAGRLRTLVVPLIEALSHRLVVAGHDTALDDRLDESAPFLRFLIKPWSGPFDQAEGRDGAVLEIVSDAPRAPSVTGRIWLDPTAPAPSEQIEVAAGALTEEWIERLLLDFVEKALSQA